MAGASASDQRTATPKLLIGKVPANLPGTAALCYGTRFSVTALQAAGSLAIFHCSSRIDASPSHPMISSPE
jgi:hypothetical protein